MFTIQFGDYTFPNQTFEVRAMALSNQIKESAIPRSHGAKILTPYLKSRTIRIRGKVHASAEDTALTSLLSLQNALIANGEQWLYLRSDRCIKATLVDFDHEPIIGTDKKVFDIDISMKAQIPFFYSAGISYQSGFTVSGTTYSFDVYSGGNVFAEPIISVYASGATISDNIKLTNQSDDNSFLRFRGTVPAGQTLRISSEDLTVLLNGVDGLSDFEGNFLSLVAGTNTFQYVGANARVTVEHKYRWYN